MEAVGDDRLRVRFANGHCLEVWAPPEAPASPGDWGFAALSAKPAGGWRFAVAA